MFGGKCSVLSNCGGGLGGITRGRDGYKMVKIFRIDQPMLEQDDFIYTGSQPSWIWFDLVKILKIKT